MSERTVGRLTLLSRAPQFRLLFIATAGSALGTYLTAAVLALQMNHLTHSGRWISALLVADFLPIAVIGFTLGPLIDRLGLSQTWLIFAGAVTLLSAVLGTG